jgi:hypothetical protein
MSHPRIMKSSQTCNWKAVLWWRLRGKHFTVEKALVLVLVCSGQQMAAVTTRQQFRQNKERKVTKIQIFDTCSKYLHIYCYTGKTQAFTKSSLQSSPRKSELRYSEHREI